MARRVLFAVQGDVEQAVEVFYQCLLLGWQKGRSKLLAESTIDVSKSGQQYVDMLAEVNARLTRDGYGQAVAHVSSSAPYTQPFTLLSQPFTLLTSLYLARMHLKPLSVYHV